MKNSCKKIVSLIFIFSLFICGVYADDAIVTSIKGKVEVNHGDDNWIQLAIGDKVSESDVVSTGFQSEVKIKYNGSVMLLGALTRVTLNQMSSSSKTDKVDVFLNTGAVRSKVTHTEDKKVSYNVRGPVAVASVRGTDFTCFANGNVQCFEGAVAVYPARSFVDVEAESNNESETEEEAADESAEVTETESEQSQDGDSDGGNSENSTSEESTSANVNEEPVIAPVNSTETVNDEPATATTPAQEISSSAPAGAVVVAQNQETTITSTGKTEKPLEVTTKNINKAKTQVSTAASKETVSAGSPAETPAPVEPIVRKGSISIKITLDD